MWFAVLSIWSALKFIIGTSFVYTSGIPIFPFTKQKSFLRFKKVAICWLNIPKMFLQHWG